MKYKRPAAFLLALALMFGEMSSAYAYEDISANSYNETVEEVHDENAVGFLSCVSGGDISSSESVLEEEIETVEEEISFEEWHGHATEDMVEVPAEIQNDPEKSAVYYRSYYNQLNDLGKLFYNTLLANYESFANPAFTLDINVKEYQTELRTDVAVKEAFRNAYAAFDYDHPEIFWLRPSAFAYVRTSNANTGITNKITIKLNSKMTSFYQAPYDTDPGRIETDKVEMEEYVSAVIAGASQFSKFDEKITYINDRLVNDNYYNRYVARNQSANASNLAWESTSALTSQTWLKSASDLGSKEAPVCEGYSRAFKLICNRLGIYCIQVTGNSHMWNYVQDHTGTWYAVDTTWDDPVRSDEYSSRTTPSDKIHRYVLVGSKTVIGGSTFISRHPANGAFWKEGTAFSVPDLCECTYLENAILTNCSFFVALSDEREAEITIYDDEFAYFETLSEAVEKVKALSEEYPSKKIILQLNRDVVIENDALSQLEGIANVVLSVNSKTLSFEVSDSLSVPNIDIYDVAGKGYCVKLTRDLTVTGMVSYPEATVLTGEHILILDASAKLAIGSVKGGAVYMQQGSRLVCERIAGLDRLILDSSVLVLTKGDSEIDEITPVNDAKLLRTENAALRISKNIVSAEGHRLGMGLIVPVGNTAEYYFSLEENNLPLSSEDFVLFSTPLEAPELENITILSSSTQEMKAVFEAGLVYAKALSIALYAINAESDTRALIEKFTSLSEALGYIDSLGNRGKDYLVAITRNIYETSLVAGKNMKSLCIEGWTTLEDDTKALKRICVSGDVSLSADVSFTNIGLEAANLSSTKLLSFDKCTADLTGNLSVNTLEMTDTVITAGGTVSITSLVSKTPSNAIFYGESGENYITEAGRITLFKNGSFSKSFTSVQAALNHISTVKDASAQYTVMINDEADAEEQAKLWEVNLMIPGSDCAAGITFACGGEKKHLYFKNAIGANTKLTFENIILNPKGSKISIDLKGKSVTLKGCAVKDGAYISSLTDSSSSRSSAFALENTDITLGSASVKGYVKLLETSRLLLKGESELGTLVMDENSMLENETSATIRNISAPEGTIKTHVSTKKSGGLITTITPSLTVTGDFASTEGNGLKVVPVDNGLEIDESLIMSGCLSGNELAVLKAPELSPSKYENNTLHKLVIINGSYSVNTIKRGGRFLFSDAEPQAVLTYGTNSAQAVCNINEAFEEIETRAVKGAYTIVLTGNSPGTLTNVSKGSEYISSLTITGLGKTLYSKKTLSMSYPVTLDNLSWEHGGSISFADLKEQNGASLYASGALTVKNIVSENSLKLGNTVDSKKHSQITVSGRVTQVTPVTVELYTDTDKAHYLSLSNKNNTLINAGKNTPASSFRVASENLPGGCVYTDDTNFTEAGYLLTNNGTAIKCIFTEDVSIALVKGESPEGVLPALGSGDFVGFYTNLDEAVKAADALDDSLESYTVVLLKNIETGSFKTPLKAEKLVVVSKSGLDCSLRVTGTTTLNCDTVISLNADNGASLGTVKGYASSLEIHAEEEKAAISGKINVEKLVVSGKEATTEISLNGKVTAGEAVLGNGVTADFKGTVKLGNITCSSGEAKAAFRRTDKNSTMLTITGKISGKVSLVMVTDKALDEYSSRPNCGKYVFTDSKKLVNFTGFYNRNDLSFIISSKGTETNLVAEKYLLISGGGVYWAPCSETEADNLTLLCDEETIAPDSYTGEVLMNFADASKAVSHLSSMNVKDRDIFVLADKTDRINVTASETAPNLKLNVSGYCRSLTLVGSDSMGETEIARLSGKGQIVFKNFGVITVKGKMNISGSLKLENTSLKTLNSANINTLEMDSASTLALAKEGVLSSVIGDTGSSIEVYQTDTSTKKTNLTVKGTWDKDVIVTVKDKNGNVIRTLNELFKDSAGRVYNKTMSDMQVELKLSEGSSIGYFESLNAAFACIKNINRADQAYIIEILPGLEVLYPNGASISTLKVSPKASTVTITTKQGADTATLRVLDGSISKKGASKLIFDRVCLEGRKSSGALKEISLTVSGGSVYFTSATETATKSGTVSGICVSNISAEKGTLGLENTSLKASGSVSVKNLDVKGSSSIDARKQTSIGNITGTGTVYINQYTTKAVRRKSSTLLTISGNVSLGVRVGLIPYGYSETMTLKGLTTTDLEGLLVAKSAAPKSYTKLVNAPKAAGDSFFICDSSHDDMVVSATIVNAYKYQGGIYATVEGTPVKLVGSAYEGSFMTLGQAFNEIDRLNRKTESYTILLSGDVGEAQPETLTWPAKAAKVTIKNDGGKKKIYVANTISLKCNACFEGVTPVYKNNDGNLATGPAKLNGKTLTLKAFDNLVNTGLNITGNGKISVILSGDEEVSLIGCIKSVTTLEISGEGTVNTGTSDVSVQNLVLTDGAKLQARNVTVSKKTTLRNATLCAGTRTVGTGAVNLNHVVYCDNSSEIDAKQDAKGDSLLNISGKVTCAGNATDKLTVGIMYNNSVCYAQWYKGMKILTGSKVDSAKFVLKYTDTTVGMGSAATNMEIQRKGKYLVIDYCE